LAGAVIVSGFVALTLTPMMCSKLLRHNATPGRVRPRHGAPSWWVWPLGYEGGCAWVLAHRWIVAAGDGCKRRR
jgi:multidrug efflux pump